VKTSSPFWLPGASEFLPWPPAFLEVKLETRVEIERPKELSAPFSFFFQISASNFQLHESCLAEHRSRRLAHIAKNVEHLAVNVVGTECNNRDVLPRWLPLGWIGIPSRISRDTDRDKTTA